MHPVNNYHRDSSSFVFVFDTSPLGERRGSSDFFHVDGIVENGDVGLLDVGVFLFHLLVQGDEPIPGDDIWIADVHGK